MILSKRQRAWIALHDIGCCCTWNIRCSSEGCSISIGGIPVLLSDESEPNDGELEFFRADGPYDLEDAILAAADAWHLKCYSDRPNTWCRWKEQTASAVLAIQGLINVVERTAEAHEGEPLGIAAQSALAAVHGGNAVE